MPLHSEGVLKKNAGAFSLIELVLALGVFAGAWVAIAGLLPSLLGAAHSGLETAAAERAAHTVLARLYGDRLPAPLADLLMEASDWGDGGASDPRLLFVDRHGADARTASEIAALPVHLRREARYFEAALVRNPVMSPSEDPESDRARGVTLLVLHLSWPAVRADGEPAPRAYRRRYYVSAAVRS